MAERAARTYPTWESETSNGSRGDVTTGRAAALQEAIGNHAVASLVTSGAPSGVARQAAIPATCPLYEPDAAAVGAIVDGVLPQGRSSTYDAAKLQSAWYAIRQRREQPGGANCCSAELAAAEHYLYARFAVVNRDHSPAEMKVMVWGWGYLKGLFPRTGICPPSRDTQASRDWGYRGVDDGVRDIFAQELAQGNRPKVPSHQATATT